MDAYRPGRLGVEARVEQPLRVAQRCALEESDLDVILERAHRNEIPLLRPDRRVPLPLFDRVWGGSANQLAQLGEDLATPIARIVDVSRDLVRMPRTASGILLAPPDPQQRPMDQLVWIRALAVLVVCGLILAAWTWIPFAALDLRDVSTRLQPHRHAWYALPMVMAVFVVLAMVPVVLLIAATGLAFGPILGPLYAMAGCLASASVGFAIGRWMGRRRVEQLGGDRIARVTRTLKRNGTLAVFFVRKVPAPFTLANIVVGASSVAYRDFIIGTLLGMGAFVVALAGFGYQLTKALRSPSPETWIGAGLFVGVPLTLAWLINRTLKRARPAE